MDAEQEVHEPPAVTYSEAMDRLREAAERVGWSRTNDNAVSNEAVDELVEAAYALLAVEASIGAVDPAATDDVPPAPSGPLT